MKKSSDPIEEYYNQHHLTEISRKGYYSEKVQFITGELKKISTKKKLRILDIACNDGELTQYYGEYGKITGLDINKQSVKKCRQRGIECLLGDVSDISEKYKNHFDVIIAGDIIEHVFDTDQFLEHIKKMLKSKGVLLLTTANLVSFGRRFMFLLGINPYIEYSSILPSPEYNVGHIRYYTIENMLHQLNYHKFKYTQIYGDKINITKQIAFPYKIAKHFPTLARNMFVYTEKN